MNYLIAVYMASPKRVASLPESVKPSTLASTGFEKNSRGKTTLLKRQSKIEKRIGY